MYVEKHTWGLFTQSSYKSLLLVKKGKFGKITFLVQMDGDDILDDYTILFVSKNGLVVELPV